MSDVVIPEGLACLMMAAVSEPRSFWSPPAGIQAMFEHPDFLIDADTQVYDWPEGIQALMGVESI